MIRENRRLGTDKPVEFEKQPVEIQDCRKITDHSRGIYRIYPNLIKGKPKDVNMSLVGLANTRISTDYAQNLPGHCFQWPNTVWQVDLLVKCSRLTYEFESYQVLMNLQVVYTGIIYIYIC